MSEKIQVQLDSSSRRYEFWLESDGLHWRRTDQAAKLRLSEAEGVLSFQDAVARQEHQLSLFR